MSGVLERRGEDVDLRWWRGWRCLGERERRRRGLGVEDGYGRRGEREGEVDMGRRWRARWRPGEREWWWRGLGVVDGYGWRGGVFQLGSKKKGCHFALLRQGLGGVAIQQSFLWENGAIYQRFPIARPRNTLTCHL